MSVPEPNLPTSVLTDSDRDEELAQIREALRHLRYGAVNVIVQDGVVVQIDRTEKRRLRRGDAK